MPLHIPPAIIHPVPLTEVRFGLSVAVSKVEYDRFALPADWRDGTIGELLAYLPRDLRHLPPWMLQAMLPGISAIPLGAGGGVLKKTTTFFTATSASNQTWSVLSDWNSADNTFEFITSGGGGGGDGGGGCCGPNVGGAGGGGGYIKKSNVPLTASGSMPYRLRAGSAGNGTTNGDWANGTTFAGASIAMESATNGQGGAFGGADGAGAITGTAIGDTAAKGGDGGSGIGGGAGGPGGAGADGVSGGAAGAGQLDGTHKPGAGAGGVPAGNLYGGGVGESSSGGNGAQGVLMIVNNALHGT